MKTRKQKDKVPLLLFLAIVCAVLGFAAIFFPFFEIDGKVWGRYKIDIGKYQDLGQFLSGVTAPFFSLAAFFLLYLTYSSQREELQLNREEFHDQNQTLKQQRFETTFFNMLHMHEDIVDKMTMGMAKGRSVIDIAKRNLQRFLEKTMRPPEVVLKEDYLDQYYHEYESNFNHYFRQLYHIFKFIYFSPLKIEEKNFYASIARSALSQNELFLIAFNAVVDDYGYPNLLYLIKEFKILKNFRHTDVQPGHFWQYILREIEEVSYEFKMQKPQERNIH